MDEDDFLYGGSTPTQDAQQTAPLTEKDALNSFLNVTNGEDQKEEVTNEEEGEDDADDAAEEDSEDDIEIVLDNTAEVKAPTRPSANRVLSLQTSAHAVTTTGSNTTTQPSLTTTEYTPHSRTAPIPQPPSQPVASQQPTLQTRAPFTFPLPPTPSDILATQHETVLIPPPSPPTIPLEPLPERESGLADIDDLDKLPNDQAPWRASGANLSDYFNYGFDERDWKVYRLRQKFGEGRVEPPKQRGGEGGGKSLTFKEEMPFAAFAFGNVREAYLSLPAPLKTLMLSTILSASGYPPQIFVQLSNPAFQQMIINWSQGGPPPSGVPGGPGGPSGAGHGMMGMNTGGMNGMQGMMGGMGMGNMNPQMMMGQGMNMAPPGGMMGMPGPGFVGGGGMMDDRSFRDGTPGMRGDSEEPMLNGPSSQYMDEDFEARGRGLPSRGRGVPPLAARGRGRGTSVTGRPPSPLPPGVPTGPRSLSSTQKAATRPSGVPGSSRRDSLDDRDRKSRSRSPDAREKDRGESRRSGRDKEKSSRREASEELDYFEMKEKEKKREEEKRDRGSSSSRRHRKREAEENESVSNKRRKGLPEDEDKESEYSHRDSPKNTSRSERSSRRK